MKNLTCSGTEVVGSVRVCMNLLVIYLVGRTVGLCCCDLSLCGVPTKNVGMNVVRSSHGVSCEAFLMCLHVPVGIKGGKYWTIARIDVYQRTLRRNREEIRQTSDMSCDVLMSSNEKQGSKVLSKSAGEAVSHHDPHHRLRAAALPLAFASSGKTEQRAAPAVFMHQKLFPRIPSCPSLGFITPWFHLVLRLQSKSSC